MNYLRQHWGYLTEPGTYPGIDLLRALAVTLVLFFHFSFIPVGWVGVDLFFVISGFLIGGIILDKAVAGRFSMKDFYWRRALRILPIYYFVILICAWFKASGPLDAVAMKSILSGVFFLQTTGPYFFPEIFQLNQSYLVGGSWSLVIEEMFYLVAPIVLLLFVKLGKGDLRIVAGLVALVVISGVFTRIVMTSGFAEHDFNWHYANFVQFHSRYDELAAGVFSACLVRVLAGAKSQSVWWIGAGAVLSSGFLIFMYQHPGYLVNPTTFARETIWLPTLLAAMGTALLMGAYWWPVRVWQVVVLARLSYPLYLVHIVVAELVNLYVSEGVLLWLIPTLTIHGWRVVLIMCSVLLAYLASLVVEYPFIRLYKGRKSNTVEPASNGSLVG